MLPASDVRPTDSVAAHPLVRAVAQLQTEGVADLIDKRALLDRAHVDAPTDSWYARHYKQHVRTADSTLHRIDSLLTVIARDSSLMQAHAEQIWHSLPFGAHPHGAFMAKAIEDALGRPAIIETLDNPFAFLRAYNRAALRSSPRHPPFSAPAMQVLAALEAKYVR